MAGGQARDSPGSPVLRSTPPRAMVQSHCRQIRVVLPHLLPALRSQEEPERKVAILFLTEVGPGRAGGPQRPPEPLSCLGIPSGPTPDLDPPGGWPAQTDPSRPSSPLWGSWLGSPPLRPPTAPPPGLSHATALLTFPFPDTPAPGACEAKGAGLGGHGCHFHNACQWGKAKSKPSAAPHGTPPVGLSRAPAKGSIPGRPRSRAVGGHRPPPCCVVPL